MIIFLSEPYFSIIYTSYLIQCFLITRPIVRSNTLLLLFVRHSRGTDEKQTISLCYTATVYSVKSQPQGRRRLSLSSHSARDSGQLHIIQGR